MKFTLISTSNYNAKNHNHNIEVTFTEDGYFNIVCRNLSKVYPGQNPCKTLIKFKVVNSVVILHPLSITAHMPDLESGDILTETELTALNSFTKPATSRFELTLIA